MGCRACGAQVVDPRPAPHPTRASYCPPSIILFPIPTARRFVFLRLWCVLHTPRFSSPQLHNPRFVLFLLVSSIGALQALSRLSSRAWMSQLNLAPSSLPSVPPTHPSTLAPAVPPLLPAQESASARGPGEAAIWLRACYAATSDPELLSCGSYYTCLRAGYAAMPDTDLLSYGSYDTCLRAGYAIPGADIPYDTTRVDVLSKADLEVSPMLCQHWTWDSGCVG